MANSKSSTERSEQAIVDTNPGVNGYGCNPVSPASKLNEIGWTNKKICFFISQIASEATVTLQWKKSVSSDYTDYDTYTSVTRLQIHDDSFGVYYRAIVKEDAQGSGSTIFGIDW